MRHVEARVFALHGWEIDLSKRELRTYGSAVPIGSRAFEIMEMLVQSAGEVVTKDDLMRRVWPGLVVEENTVQVHISAIRKALGPDREMLKTISGRGYCLLGDWTAHPAAPAVQPAEAGLAHPAAHRFTTNIPMAASALVGRETAIRQLRDLVSTSRIVTLTGAGGIGKTVLASEVARGLFPQLAGDVLFVELVSLSDPGLVPSTVAQVLDLQLHGDEISAEAVARAVGGRRLLLVLDNCEHVIDTAATTAEILVRFCPNLSVLATSRELLRIEGELAYCVPALEVPAADSDDAGDVLEHSAVQLFIARTRSLRADFRPQGDELAAIAAICRQLDGIPLAIEFAAARTATLGVRQVAGRLDDRFALLTSGRRTAVPRHQTLRATLDWSYELLPEIERRLLRHLAIFPAGFTVEAAASVTGDAASSVAIGLSNLVSKSLVTLDGSEVVPRWRLLETVRMYAFEKLVDGGEEAQVMRSLAEFCLAFFAPFDGESGLQVAGDDLGPYRRDIDTLRTALTWAFSAGGDAAQGVRLAAAVSDFWVAVSLVAEAGEWAATALAEMDEPLGTRPEMILLCSLGFALIYTQGMSAGARKILLAALALARTLGDFDYQQRATCGLWLFSARSMALDDALRYARDYEAVARDRDAQSRAIAAWMIGIPQTYMAMHVEAGERLDHAIRPSSGAGRHSDMLRLGADIRTSAAAHNTVNLVSRGFLDTASRTAASTIEDARATKQPFVLCVALAWAAGFVSLSLGELDRARDYGEELVDHAFKHGLQPFHATGLCVRGSLAARRGDPEAGIGPLRAGLAEMQRASYLLFYPFFLTEFATALGAMGRFDEALDEIGKALRFANRTKYHWFVPEILRAKGDLLSWRGHDDMASIESLFRQSMDQAGAQDAVYWELSAATSLAALLRREHRDREAHQVLSPVFHRLTEGFSAPRVMQARLLLDQLS